MGRLPTAAFRCTSTTSTSSTKPPTITAGNRIFYVISHPPTTQSVAIGIYIHIQVTLCGGSHSYSLSNAPDGIVS